MIPDRMRLPRCTSSTRADAPPKLVEAACAAIVHKASTASRNAVVASGDSLERSSVPSAIPNETGGAEGVVLAEVDMAQRVAASPMAPNTVNGALTTLPKPGAEATSV